MLMLVPYHYQFVIFPQTCILCSVTSQTIKEAATKSPLSKPSSSHGHEVAAPYVPQHQVLDDEAGGGDLLGDAAQQLVRDNVAKPDTTPGQQILGDEAQQLVRDNVAEPHTSQGEQSGGDTTQE